MKRAIVLLALAACGNESAPTELHEIGSLEYEMPVGWQSRDQSQSGRRIVVWTPDDNPRKESITLVRSEALPALTKAGVGALEHHLVRAQLGLAGRFSPAQVTRSKHGLAGVRLHGSFVPPSDTRTYTRAHAVFIDGEHLVHVLYTAQIADTSHETLSQVIDSLARKGA